MTAAPPANMTCCDSPPIIENWEDPSRFEMTHPRPFWTKLVVASSQVSRAVEHASNVEYVRWLDRAAELHADALGFTRQQMPDIDRMWFVARHEIDYMAEAWPGDELFIATWVETMGKTTSWRQTRIIRPHDERLICRAATLWVWVNLKTRRPVRIPDEVASRFDAAKFVESAKNSRCG